MTRSKTILRCSTTLSLAVATMLTIPAHAQNTNESADKTVDDNVIIVTAQRRAENIQDVPAAVTALSAKQLETRQVNDTNDLQIQIPNVVISTGTGTANSARIFFRGVGEDESRGAVDPAVGIYLDGVYLGRTVGSLVDLVDVAQIEVLRGPQGTLYGRNTIGGAIKINSIQPEIGGYSLDAELGVGSDDRFSIKSSINAGLGESTALRVSTLYKKRDGYFTLNPTGALAGLAGTNIGDENVFAIRASLLQELGENWSALLTYDHTIDKTDPTPSTIITRSSNPALVTDVDNNLFTIEPQAGVNCGAVSPFSPIGCFPNFSSRVESTGISLKLEGNLGDFTVTSTSAYRTLEDDLSTHISFPFTQQTDQDQFSQELLLSSDLEGPFNFVAGAYYYKEDVQLDSVFIFPSAMTVETESLAFFGQGTFDVTDQLTLTGGIRYTTEDRDFFGTGIAGTNTGTLSTDNITYTGKIDYSFTDDVLVYASFSTGFKSPGFASDCFSAAACFAPVQEENLDSIEAGLRTTFLDGRANFNATYFYNNYTDLQISATNSLGQFSRSNVAKARIQGVELEANIEPVDGLTIYAHASWLDAKYKSITAAQAGTITGTNFVSGAVGPACGGIITAAVADPAFQTQTVSCALGLQLKNAPEIKATIGFNYAVPLASGEVSFGGDVAYEDDSFGLVANPSGSLIEPGVRMNARISYAPDNESWKVTLWGKNLTDRQYYRATTGANNAFAAPPLTWGVDFGVSF